MDDNPSFDCLDGKHLFFEFYDEYGTHVGGWCPWCGSGTYDGDRVTADGQPIGFQPYYILAVPEGFYR